MGFQRSLFLLSFLFLLSIMITVTETTDNIHDFLGLNEPFFNPNIESTFKAQEGGVAFLSCEVAKTLQRHHYKWFLVLLFLISLSRCSTWTTSQCPGFEPRTITSWRWTERLSSQARQKISTLMITFALLQNHQNSSSTDPRFSSLHRRAKMSDTVTLAIQVQIIHGLVSGSGNREYLLFNL